MKAKARKAKAKHSHASKRSAKIITPRGGVEGMEIVNPHAGGIDCGAQEHYVAVPPQSVEPGERDIVKSCVLGTGASSLN